MKAFRARLDLGVLMQVEFSGLIAVLFVLLCFVSFCLNNNSHYRKSTVLTCFNVFPNFNCLTCQPLGKGSPRFLSLFMGVPTL